MNFLKNLTSALLDEQEKFTDLTQVAVVDSDACLDVLKKRFDNSVIYTNCGPLLVAVNPYCEIDGMYSTEVLEKFLAVMPAETPEPHVYGMAARAYQKMMANGSNQSVVISGESGAGKTETAKLLLTYLAAAASGTSAGSADSRGALQGAVMATNPIMESYGCAKTVRNDNSSRFGKLVLLKFTKTGRLEAASMQTYLLEKSRVVYQSATECNFHAFHETLAGGPAAERVAVGLPAKGSPTFAYLNTAGGKARSAERDAESHAKTVAAMTAVGLRPAEIAGVAKLLVALLNLGNISFGDGDEAKLEATGSSPAAKAVQEAARLLATDPTHLATGMCSRRLKAGSDWVTTQNSVDQAVEVRHALVKQLYSYIFMWLVKRINKSLARTPAELAEGPYGGGKGPHIAYVDIFGFEIFQSNSLEQLCINFANEKLQKLFVGVLFESVQQMYDDEGIHVEKTEYADNKRVVDLIGGAPTGLLSMLTEECVFPKGTDSTYLQKVNAAFTKKNELFVEVKTSSTEFGVSHFAGEVIYDVTGFIEKNKDPISQDLQVLIEFSDDPFIVQLMKETKEIMIEAAATAAANAEAPARGGAAKGKGKGTSMRSGKFVGVVDGFKTSLRSLIMTLQDGELHFIRCLKPNDDKQSLTWNRDVSQRQLLSAGLVTAVAATREGYADHLPPVHVTQAFSPLCPDLDLSGLDINSMETASQVLAACGVDADSYAIGKTKVFLRPGVLNELQRQRMEHIGQFATVMQAMIRGALARILLRRLKEAAFRKAEEKRRREDEVRRQREEAERRRQEAVRLEAEAKAKAEAEEAERRKTVQKARSLSFDRKRRKKVEEEERIKREQEEAERARKASNEAKRAEAAERMRAQLALQENAPSIAPVVGAVDVGDPENTASVEALVARAEAEAAAASGYAGADLELPESPSPVLGGGGFGGGGGGGGGGGFMLQLPESPMVAQLGGGPAATPGKLVEQRRLDEAAAQFVCPLVDVVAYAEMIGMDVQEDMDLLWIADEALQAPEPVGWEERMDPRGNTYYCNTQTNMTMMQHPVDYHYQQLYLQFKMQREQQQKAQLMTPRSRANFESQFAQQLAVQQGKKKLDLRSINGDSGDEPAVTPRGWISRTASMMTPRGSSKSSIPPCSAHEHMCTEVEVLVRRGGERLGMELNAYNQILSFQPGGPTDRHPDIHISDRILGVDGVRLDNRMLTDVLVPAEQHNFLMERWIAPAGMDASRALDTPTLLALGKARAHGQTSEAAVDVATKEHIARYKKKGRRGKEDINEAPISSRFTVSLARIDGGGLGLVCDEDNVVVDMVPNSPADIQRHGETRGDPRLQIGDRLMTVDGVAISREQPLSAVITPKHSHCLSVERSLEADIPDKKKAVPSSPMSPRGMLKALNPMSPRSSKVDKRNVQAEADKPKVVKAPTRALREVRLFKGTEDERLGIRFVREDEGFDCDAWGAGDYVTPIVAALDPKGEAARAGMEIDDMVLSINGQTGLSNTEAAAMLRDLAGTVVVVVRKTTWLGTMAPTSGTQAAEDDMAPQTPRSATRRLV